MKNKKKNFFLKTNMHVLIDQGLSNQENEIHKEA